MKRSDLRKSGLALFLSAMVFGVLLLISCSGGGSSGPQGPAGPTGPAGPVETTPLVTTTETCEVCHSAGKIADIAVFHPDPTGKDVALSNIILTNTLINNTETPVVTFHAETSTGPVTNINAADARFYMAALIPAGTVTSYPNAVTGVSTWDSSYFERWASETANTARFVNNGLGNYTYTFSTAFSSASAAAPDYKPNYTQRLFIRISGRSDTVNGPTNNSVGFLDFVVPAAGTDAVPLDSQRLFVTADACKKCHSPLFQQAAHANNYLDTRGCVVCHSPLGVYSTIMQRDNAWLSVFIHQIHAAIDNPAFPEEVNGLGFGGVTYPQNIMNCVACHSNPSGANLGTGDEIDNWKTHPTAEVCVSCHTDVNFATGANHPGGIQTNTYCNACHLNGTNFSLSVVQAHDTTPRIAGTNGVPDVGYLPENIPEFYVALYITPPTNGSYYVAGETPEVRVSLADHATGSPVAPAVYTTPQDAAGVTGGGLNVASLYVYGPRARSVPVLATGTMTDSAFNSETDVPTQEHQLFLPSADPQVTTDSGSFGYRLLPIPEGMTAGTYMVRVRIGDYGRVGTGNYRIESTGFINIQIGTATEEVKVSGNNCVDCHGNGTAPFHDERHAVVFNTDQCLACHDQSGNFAIPLANRVHAVHSANPSGDIYNIEAGAISSSRDWSDVTYPQNLAQVDASGNPLYADPRCVGCHSSGDTTYKTLPYMMPCVACHTVDGDIDHMRQNGGPF
jgi:hypothetical protein